MHSLAAKRDLGSAQSDADRQRRRLTNPHKLPFRGVVSEDWPPEMRPKSNPPVGAGRSCRRLHPPTAPYRDRVRPRRHLECYRPSLAPKCRVAQRSNPGTAVRSHSRWACPCQYSASVGKGRQGYGYFEASVRLGVAKNHHGSGSYVKSLSFDAQSPHTGSKQRRTGSTR